MLAAIGLCVYASIMMPWAELDMDTKTLPHTFRLLHLQPVADALDNMYGSHGVSHRKHLDDKKAEGKRGEYVYSWAIAIALLAGGIAIAAIGGTDDEEKTLVPEKK